MLSGCFDTGSKTNGMAPKPPRSCHACLKASRADNSSRLVRDYHQIIVKIQSRPHTRVRPKRCDEDIKQKHTVIDLPLAMPPPFLFIGVVTEITNIKLEGVYRSFNLSIWGEKSKFFSPLYRSSSTVTDRCLVCTWIIEEPLCFNPCVSVVNPRACSRSVSYSVHERRLNGPNLYRISILPRHQS